MSKLLHQAIFITTLLTGSMKVTAEPVLIGHPEINVNPDLTAVKRLYLGKDKSLGGKEALSPIDVDENSRVRPIFLEKVVDKTETELRQYWSRLVFTGKGIPPRSVGGDEAVRQWVATNKNSVGIIDSALVDQSVKVLLNIK
jgi:hypothetical protein